MVEVYNSLDMNVLHGTKFEKYGFYHRVLEMRKIARHFGQRYMLFREYNNWAKWEVNKGSISDPPPLSRKLCCYHKCCLKTQKRLKRKWCGIYQPPLRAFCGVVLGLIENAGLWIASARCCNCCCKRCYTTKIADKTEDDKETEIDDETEDGKNEELPFEKIPFTLWRQIKLPGWTNKLIGKVKVNHGKYEVSFLDDKFLYDVAHLLSGATKREQKDAKGEQKDGATMKTRSNIEKKTDTLKNFTAYEGDIILFNHGPSERKGEAKPTVSPPRGQRTRVSSNGGPSITTRVYAGIVIYCDREAKTLKICPLGKCKINIEKDKKETVIFESTAWQLFQGLKTNIETAESEKNQAPALQQQIKNIPKKVLKQVKDAYKKNRKYIYEIEERNIVGGRHVYPIETYWDKKENEPEYLIWQMFYRVVNNILRVALMWLSYLVTLVTIIWCILGLFIFPERFGPYTTGIFVCITNARVLFIRMTGYYDKIRSLVQEGLRAETLEREVIDLLEKAKKCSDESEKLERELESEKLELAEKDLELIGTYKRTHGITLQLLESAIPGEVAVAYLETLVEKYDELIEEGFEDFSRFEDLKNKTEELKKDLNSHMGKTTCTIDDIIPRPALEKVMRKYNVSTKAVIGVVAISSLSLIVLVAFLIVGMQVFTDSDPFSAGITSGLTVIAGLSLNLRNGLEALGDSDFQILVDKIIADYRAMQRADGISLDDKLQDVLRVGARDE
jgi:hypothetical protein